MDKQYPQIIDENFGWIKKNRVNLHLNCEIVADGLVDFLIATRTNFKIYDPRSTYSNLISELSRRNK